MRYLFLLLLLLPLAAAENFTYEPQHTFFPDKDEVLKENILITNNGQDTTAEFRCEGDLCTYLKYEQTFLIPSNFTVEYPLTIFSSEIGEQSAQLHFGEKETIEIRTIVLNSVLKKITDHLFSGITVNSPDGQKSVSFSWYWVYLVIFILGIFMPCI